MGNSEYIEKSIMSIRASLEQNPILQGWDIIEIGKRPNCNDVFTATIRRSKGIFVHTVFIPIPDNGDGFDYLKNIELFEPFTK